MSLSDLPAHILSINDWVWQPAAMPVLLLFVGGWLTIRSGFVQVRRFPLALRMVMKGAFAKRTKDDEGTITPFQALSTALASTVGNGNIGGGVLDVGMRDGRHGYEVRGSGSRRALPGAA